MSASVILFGYGEPALVALDTFARLAIDPRAVVVPGNRSGPVVDEVVAEAGRRGLRVLVQPPRSALEPFLSTVQQLRPDFLFVWSYPMLLPASLRAVAPRGAINLHGAALPEYRGGHAMNWTLINGERESAATLHVIDDGIDTGPVIAARPFPLGPDDDIAFAQKKLMAAGSALLSEWWPRIERGEACAVPQDESRARHYRMRTPDDGVINWRQSNVQVHNLTRALAAPWPGSRTFAGTTQLVLRRTAIALDPGVSAVPGTVLAFSPGDLVVACGSGALRIMDIEIDQAKATHPDLLRAGIGAGVVLRGCD